MHFFTLLLIGTCLIIPATGIETTARTCRVLFLAPPDGAPEKLFLSDGSSIQEVELPSMNLSKVYSIAGGEITLSMFADKPATGLPLPADAPKAAVAETLVDFYLLVSSDPANKIAPVRFQIIPANADGFKRGQMLWYNLSSHRVGGRVGQMTLNLPPNSKTLLDAPADRNEDYNVKIGYVPESETAARPLCETTWLHDPRSRNLLFVIPVPGSRAPRIMGFPDFREETKTD